MRSPLTARSFLCLLGLAQSAHLLAQCDPAWVAAGGSIGAEDRIRALTMWDPDGAGPQPERLVVAGDFAYIGDDTVSLIAMLDPVTGHWQPLGAGLPGYAVFHLAVLTTGELVASGTFSNGGNAFGGIASFDGTNWSWLSTTFGADALIPQPGGDLVVASNDIPQSQWVGTVRRWNGSTWSQVAPTTTGRIATMVQMPNGDLVAGGQMTSAGGVAVANIARWSGVAWSPLGSGVDSAVNALAVLSNGDLVVGGYLLNAGGQPAARIARWDGTAWHAFGSGVYAVQFPAVWSLLTLANGDLIVGGYFSSIDGVPANCIARWSNGVWSDVGVGVDSQPEAILELPNGDLVFGGTFRNTAAGPANYLARWNGILWSTYGSAPPCDGPVVASAVAPDGDLVIVGSFSEAFGVPANQVARRTSSGWQGLGSGVDGSVRAVAVLPDGDVVVGGYLSSAGGVPVTNLARWDGTAWSAIGGLTGGSTAGVRSMCVMSDGALLVGGSFAVAGGAFLGRWDGANWSSFGTGPTFPVTVVSERANGDLLVAAAGTSYFTSVERWDGSSWTSITGSTPTQVRAILPLPDGDMMIGGFSPVLSRWDGANLTPLPLEYGSSVTALALQPNGDVLASGVLVIGGVGYRLARWDGSSWTGLEVGSGFSLTTLSLLPDGEIAVGGNFSIIGGLVSPNFASLVPTCPATAVEFGAGCAGSNGLEHLSATALPWVGSTFRARATGMPDQSFVATIFGFTQLAVPLTLLFQQAGAGCIGHCSGDAIDIAFPVAGEVASQVVLPNNPSLVGVTFEHYALAFEFDLLGSLIEVTSTNGLSMTIGTF